MALPTIEMLSDDAQHSIKDAFNLPNLSREEKFALAQKINKIINSATTKSQSRKHRPKFVL
jgi:hypothetical protein